jgi:hypothetical protein
MFSKNKKIIFSLVVLLCFVSIFLFVRPANAAGQNVVLEKVLEYVVQPIIKVFVLLFGELLIACMKLLIFICKFNKFIDFPFVVQGWKMLRDVVNMFFIVGLLFIAFTTVLGIRKYEWTKMLFRLLFMAILVNFSRTILGLIIDAFQVIMLTFVNAVKDIAEGNLFTILNLSKLGQFSSTSATLTTPQGVDAVNVTASMVFSLIFIIISLVVILIFCIILAFRIVVLWLLIVASPVAFFAWVFEGAIGPIGSLSTQFWKYLWQYLSVGPVLAFFLWLSFSTLSTMNDSLGLTELTKNTSTNPSVGLGKAGEFSFIAGYLFSILTLIGGLIVTSQFSVMGASYAKGATDWMKKQTQSRIEGYARRAGAAAAGAGAFLAKAPVRAVKPLSAGVAKGLSERLQAGKFTQALTSAGRERLGKTWSAAAESLVRGGRKGTVYKRETEKAIAQEMREKVRTDIDFNNIDVVNRELASELKKSPRMRNNSYMEALYTAKADMGKLEDDDVKAMKEPGGFLAKKGRLERKLFLEDMEDRFQKKNGWRKSFSDYYDNPFTNQIEDFSEISQKADMTFAKIKSQTGEDLSQIPFSAITKKDKTTGLFKLDRNAEFNKLDAGKRAALEKLEADSAGKGFDSDFYNIARSGEILTKRQDEVRKSIASADQKQANLIAENIDWANPGVSPETSVAESQGMTAQRNYYGKFTQLARDNIAARKTAEYLRGEERADFIMSNKDKFSPKLLQKSGESKQDYIKRIDGYYKESDRAHDNYTEEQHQAELDAYISATTSYDADGRVIAPGKTNKVIEEKLMASRSGPAARPATHEEQSGPAARPPLATYKEQLEEIDEINKARSGPTDPTFAARWENNATNLIKAYNLPTQTVNLTINVRDQMDNALRGFDAMTANEQRKAMMYLRIAIDNYTEDLKKAGLKVDTEKINSLIKDLKQASKGDAAEMKRQIKNVRDQITAFDHIPALRPPAV